MRSLKFLAVSILAFAMTGCTCKTTMTMDGGGDNIPTTMTESPLKDIYFAFDSYKIDAAGKNTLQANAQWLKQHPGSTVQIEGHCDERGTNEYNMVLGANRARSAMDFLRSLGIEASRMTTVSYGEEIPADPRHNEEAWAKNRRVHFDVK